MITCIQERGRKDLASKQLFLCYQHTKLKAVFRVSLHYRNIFFLTLVVEPPIAVLQQAANRSGP